MVPGKKTRFIHPLYVFIGTLLAVGLSFYFYIHMYIKVEDSVNSFTHRFPAYKNIISNPASAWIIIANGLLLAIIITGMVIIFIYYQKTIQLYKLQENFINSFTHELKTPVASIKLYLETFLKYKMEDQKIKTFSSFMLKDANRLSTNINQILQIGRLENKSEKIEKEQIDLFEYTQTFLEQNRHLFSELNINLHNSQDERYLAMINQDLYDMVLMNILTNAIQHNKSEKKIVDIFFEAKRGNLFVRVKDNGLGMKKEDLKRVFKKFYQVPNKGSTSIKGSGLGLYLTQQIVKLHGGDIKVSSDGLDQGSEFMLKLPRTWSGFFQKSNT